MISGALRWWSANRREIWRVEERAARADRRRRRAQRGGHHVQPDLRRAQPAGGAANLHHPGDPRRCAREHGRRARPLDIDEAAQLLVVPEREVEAAARRLEDAGILVGVGEWPQRHHVLARPPHEFAVRDVVEAVAPPWNALPRDAFAEVSLRDLLEARE